MARKKAKEERQIAVIGLGRFGFNLAVTLEELGCEVLAVDKQMEAVQEIAGKVTHAVQADVIHEDSLKQLGLTNFDIVVISIGSSVQASILAALVIMELGVQKVVAKASSELHRKALEKIGVSRVVYPEKDSGVKLAYNLMSLNMIEFLEISPDYQIAEIIIEDTYDGKTLQEADLRNRYGLNVLAIRNGDKINVSPQADDILHKGDMLVVLGNTKDLRNFCQNC